MRAALAVLFGLMAAASPCLAAPASRGKVLALADAAIGTTGPRLEGRDAQTVHAIETRLGAAAEHPGDVDELVGDLVNQATIALAAARSLDALTVTSAYLVHFAPDSARATNLFGSVLNAGARYADAVTVFEYTVALDPEGTLAQLNLASAYLDANRDAQAKPVLDKLVVRIPDNAQVHHALAMYWYRRHDLKRTLDELIKGAKGGWVATKKREQQKKITPDEVAPDDTLAVMKTKCERLAGNVPLTTADVLEDAYPAAAKQIRSRYGQLGARERMVLPTLPEVKVNTLRDFTENHEYVTTWAQTHVDKLSPLFERLGDGADPAAAQRDAAEAMRTALKRLQQLRGMMGGAERAEVDRAITELKTQAADSGISLDGAGDAPGIPMGDTGALFAEANYKAYAVIELSYEHYLRKTFQDYQTQLTAILAPVTAALQKEALYHETRMKEIEREERARAGTQLIDRESIAFKRELLRHHKRDNEISEDGYRKWINFAWPEYAQKLKPALDDYWRTVALYLKNMNNAKVMEREYHRVLLAYLTRATQAVGAVASGPFVWEGSTDEEEAALREAEREAEANAKAKAPEYRRTSEVAGDGWSKWIEDHLVLELSGQFLSLKVTARTIQFEAWAYGPTGRIKLDVIDGVLSTYTGVTAKFDVGFNVAGAEVKLGKAKLDIAGKTATFGLEDGSYSEGYTNPSGELKLGLGPMSVTGKAEVVVADSVVAVKGSYKIAGTVKQAGW